MRSISIAVAVLVILACGVDVPPRAGSAPGNSASVVNYDFTIILPLSGRSIRGCAAITAVRKRDADRLSLDLADLVVDSVYVDGRPAKYSREPSSIDLFIGSAERIRPDTALVIVWYGGEVHDGLIIRTDRRGRWAAFGDNWPDRARRWLPTIDRPDAKATVSWNVIGPAERNVVANGQFIEQRAFPPDKQNPSVPRSLTRWKTYRPIPSYLMVIAAGPLTQVDLGLTAAGLSEFPPGVQQSVYAVPELSDYLPGPFKHAGDIVTLFSTLVAPFPYEKLAHVQSSTRYGGMENASAIFYADNVFMRRSVSIGLIAHETAHQWFGDAVTPKSWGHLWLSEGFASYFEQLWVERSEGAGAFRNGMKKLRREILQSDVTFSRPVIDTLQTNLVALLNTNSYQKGAWVLHMLRSMLGDTLFFSGIREYYRRHRHSSATSDDLCEVLEMVAHKNLRWFFDQWLRRPGMPEVSASWRFDDRTHTLTVEVIQSGKGEPYAFPLTVEVLTSQGKSSIVVLQIPAERKATPIVPVILSAEPGSVVFDPRAELLASIKSGSEQ
ncbi:MAG TPA: hypothetical protein DEP53_06230 [Bacteroidetes bacterium]|nr:hypothetical protein [Bacteroidota bacterium]